MKTVKGNLSAAIAGFSSVLIGYASSVVLVIKAYENMGASESQLTAFLTVLGIVMGAGSIAFAVIYKKPILLAWSTPGAAMFAGLSGQYQLEMLIQALLLTGMMIAATGFISPLLHALHRLPNSISAAMLSGILLPFCIGAFTPISVNGELFLILFSVFAISRCFWPKYSMLALLCCALLITKLQHSDNFSMLLSAPEFHWYWPENNGFKAFELAIPLYLVTMLSQNLPGVAMLQNHGYTAPTKSVFIGTGVMSSVLAPLGCFTVNLAAISAAICQSPDVDKDKSKRYKAAVWAGVFYLLAGVFASNLVGLFLAFEQDMIHIMIGFALIPTLILCFDTLTKDSHSREAAVITFLVTLSASSALGLSSASLGLLLGLAYLLLSRLKQKYVVQSPLN